MPSRLCTTGGAVAQCGEELRPLQSIWGLPCVRSSLPGLLARGCMMLRVPLLALLTSCAYCRAYHNACVNVKLLPYMLPV